MKIKEEVTNVLIFNVFSLHATLMFMNSVTHDTPLLWILSFNSEQWNEYAWEAHETIIKTFQFWCLGHSLHYSPLKQRERDSHVRTLALRLWSNATPWTARQSSIDHKGSHQEMPLYDSARLQLIRVDVHLWQVDREISSLLKASQFAHSSGPLGMENSKTGI